MKIWAIMFFTILALLCSFYATGSSFEDGPTPIEEDDIKTINQIDDEDSDVYGSNPVEVDDIKTINQIDDEDSDVYESNPVEEGDIKTINQINK